MNSIDKLFALFVKGLFVLLIMYGAGMILVIILGKNEIAIKLISVWSGMFGAVVGLGSGYLIGRTQPESKQEETSNERDGN